MGFTCEYLELIRQKWSNKYVRWFLEMLLNQRQWHYEKRRNIHFQQNLNFEQALEDIFLETNPNFAKDVTNDLRIPLFSETLR